MENNEYYTEVPSADLYNKEKWNNVVEFNDSTIKILNDEIIDNIVHKIKLSESNFRLTIYGRQRHSNLKIGLLKLMEWKDKLLFEVYQYPDEWFILDDFSGKYYLCDQLEGLIKCIEDIKKLNI